MLKKRDTDPKNLGYHSQESFCVAAAGLKIGRGVCRLSYHRGDVGEMQLATDASFTTYIKVSYKNQGHGPPSGKSLMITHCLLKNIQPNHGISFISVVISEIPQPVSHPSNDDKPRSKDEIANAILEQTEFVHQIRKPLTKEQCVEMCKKVHV